MSLMNEPPLTSDIIDLENNIKANNYQQNVKFFIFLILCLLNFSFLLIFQKKKE